MSKPVCNLLSKSFTLILIFFKSLLMSKPKILIDEMDDGWDEKLQQMGFDAYSVKKLRAGGEKIAY